MTDRDLVTRKLTLIAKDLQALRGLAEKSADAYLASLTGYLDRLPA